MLHVGISRHNLSDQPIFFIFFKKNICWVEKLPVSRQKASWQSIVLWIDCQIEKKYYMLSNVFQSPIKTWNLLAKNIAHSATELILKVCIHSRNLRLWNGKKVFKGFESIFYVYLIRGLQKYQRNWICTVAFWATT